MNMRSIACSNAALLVIFVLAAEISFAEDPSPVDIIKATQNPLTRDLGSIAFENIFSFGLGHEDEFGYGLLVKPSLPIVLTERWSLINRSSLPVLIQPSPVSGAGRTAGLGDLQHTTLLSPTTTRRVIWGLGPSVGFPTATNELLGGGKWLLGPAAIFVFTPRRAVFGLVVRNQWSVGGDPERPKINKLLVRPLVNINFQQGWFITSKPTIAANWKATGGERWLVPVGGGIGKVFRVGNFGISLESQAFAYPVRPDAGPSWSIGLELKVLARRGELRERVRERRHRLDPS